MNRRIPRVLLGKLCREQQGAVYAEAVIIIPFFIVIFAALLYMEGLFVNKQRALVTARSCAWQYSDDGCDKPPKGCEGIVTPAAGAGKQNEVSDRMNSGVLDVLSDVPLVGEAIRGLFGSALMSNKSRKLTRTPLFGGGKVDVHGTYYLMCNEKERTIGDILKAELCHYFSFPGC